MSVERLQNKFDELLRETRDETFGIINRLTEEPESNFGQAPDDSGIIHRPCGMGKQVPDLKPIEIEEATKKQDAIINQVKEKPMDFPELARQQGENAGIGKGAGDMVARRPLVRMGKPKWFKMLKGLVKSFGRPTRKRSREYYDNESLVRNVPEKEPAKKKERGELIFTLLDTSGSMMSQTSTGRTYMDEMGKYIPQIVSGYDGAVYQIDTEFTQVSNKAARKAFKKGNSMAYRGGGGTDFDAAYEDIIKRKRKEKFQCLVLVLTDGYVTIDPAMVQEIGSSIFVIPKGDVDAFMRFNGGVLMDMVESKKYPAVTIVAVDFGNDLEVA